MGFQKALIFSLLCEKKIEKLRDRFPRYLKKVPFPIGKFSKCLPCPSCFLVQLIQKNIWKNGQQDP